MDKKEHIRNQLRKAFKDLRLQGLLARMNFACCSNCAGYELTTIAENKINNGTPQEDIKGCAFWHGQDEQNWKEYGNLMIGYGDMNSRKYDKIGLDTKTVGEIIIKTLKHYGVPYEWDGDPNKKIHVFVERNEDANN